MAMTLRRAAWASGRYSIRAVTVSLRLPGWRMSETTPTIVHHRCSPSRATADPRRFPSGFCPGKNCGDGRAEAERQHQVALRQE
jgi:hypothetical protein